MPKFIVNISMDFGVTYKRFGTKTFRTDDEAEDFVRANSARHPMAIFQIEKVE